MSLVESVETMLKALGESDIAAADVALLRRMAMLLDENPFSEPEIYREYRFAVRAVKEALGGDDTDLELSEFLERVGGSDLQHAKNSGP